MFDPVEFLGRLAVLVPRPRINLVLYHVLGLGRRGGLRLFGARHRRQGRDQCWAELMRRTFGVDVLACPRCGGRLLLRRDYEPRMSLPREHNLIISSRT